MRTKQEERGTVTDPLAPAETDVGSCGWPSAPGHPCPLRPVFVVDGDPVCSRHFDATVRAALRDRQADNNGGPASVAVSFYR